MKVKEKAQQLIGKFFDLFINDKDEHYEKTAWRLSKKCALILVDEIIQILPTSEYLEDVGNTIENRQRTYWNQVKQEIENF
jgi:hypothetical protein